MKSSRQVHHMVGVDWLSRFPFQRRSLALASIQRELSWATEDLAKRGWTELYMYWNSGRGIIDCEWYGKALVIEGSTMISAQGVRRSW